MNILITGASSGIGAELARQYATAGHNLFLTGRDASRLGAVATSCREKKVQVETLVVDVADRQAMDSWIYKMDDQHPMDIVIANAGISVGQKARTRELNDRLLQTNIVGVLNTIDPLIPRFQKRKSGQIAVISSLASLRAFPERGVYAATKAAVRSFCDDWRLSLKKDNIRVSCVHPGFVRTPLTDQNRHAMPGIMSVEKAASIIIKGLKQEKVVIAFPKSTFFIMRLLQFLPAKMADWLILASKG
jgi:short-subunit dehydrogenase